MPNINDDPDFRLEKLEYFCNNCEKVTEHLKYLRQKTEESEDEPSHAICCRTCAVDNAEWDFYGDELIDVF